MLVGGGAVASTKYAGLRAAGAEVVVVAPWISPALRAHGTEGAHLVERAFEPADLDGAWFVVAAAPPDVNRAVAEAAAERRLFVNAVDDPPSASAYAGSVVRRGGVTVAISTGGHAPALAGLLREAFEATLPDDVARWVDEARALRMKQRAEGVPMSERRPALLDVLCRLYAPGARP